MSANMPPSSLNLESQLLSIMDVLVKAAVAEISQLFSESCASLRLHLSQSLKENEALRMRMKVMRSEVFSLRLQTRHSRPCSRFSPSRGNIPKPRANKSQVVIKPPAAQKPVGETVPISLQTESNTSSSATRTQCTDVESPDVILIKDEDDIGGCEPAGSQDDFGNPSAQDGVDAGGQSLKTSCLTRNHDELRIVSIHGRGEGPLQENSDILFSASELQALSSLSPDHKVTHDSLMNFPSCASDGVQVRGMQEGGVGLLRNTQLERNPCTQMASTARNTAIQADVNMGHPSNMSQFPQQQSIFLHAANKSLDCSFCGEGFLTREDLIVHRATHTGETPVTCSFCGKSFVNKTTLTIHMRIHTGEKPYACVQCGKRFTQNGSLKIHLRTHSGEKPYTCNQCTASFNNPSNLRRHMITHNTNGAL